MAQRFAQAVCVPYARFVLTLLFAGRCPFYDRPAGEREGSPLCPRRSSLTRSEQVVVGGRCGVYAGLIFHGIAGRDYVRRIELYKFHFGSQVSFHRSLLLLHFCCQMPGDVALHRDAIVVCAKGMCVYRGCVPAPPFGGYQGCVGATRLPKETKGYDLLGLRNCRPSGRAPRSPKARSPK